MKYKELRVRIPEDLFMKYKHICVDRFLSLPRQSAALIRQFVEVQGKNNEILKGG